MTGDDADYKCPSCDRSALRSARDGDGYVCQQCGERVAERSGGGPGTFARDYEPHDVATSYLIDQLRQRGITVTETGYDPRDGDGRHPVGRTTPAECTIYDLEANGVPVDVKSTRHRAYHGNIRAYHYEEYPPEVWVAAFVVESGSVVASGAYRVGDAEPEGRHDGAHDETWCEVTPGPLGALYMACLTRQRGGEGRA